jgi:hypothetical protein
MYHAEQSQGYKVYLVCQAFNMFLVQTIVGRVPT